MNKYIYLLAAIFIVLGFHPNVSAQKADAAVYLEPDRFFKLLALSEGRYASETELENFGRYMNNAASGSFYTYKDVAAWIIELQKNPRGFISVRSKPMDASGVRVALEADSLIIEYMMALYKPSKGFQDDPLENYVRDIQTSEGRSQLRIDLDQRLGSGVEREKKAAEILKEIKENFSESRLEGLRSSIINNSVARLPYPLCLITKNCPR